jgi:hypothetical protein
MVQHKKIVEFHLNDGTPFLIEIEETQNESLERASRLDVEKKIIEAKQSFETALDKVVPVASAALNRLRNGVETPVDEVEFKFGLKLTGEADAIFASLGGEVNFEITLKWKQKKEESMGII